MTILALDLGTKTGWALTDYRGGVRADRAESGVQTFDVKRGESPGMRYVRFTRWLPVMGLHCSLLVYEQTHQRGGAATEVAAGFATRVQEFCARENIEHTAVHSGTLKKFATGKGNAGKREMWAAAREKWPDRDFIDDNEIDALWILEYARVEIVGANAEDKGR